MSTTRYKNVNVTGVIHNVENTCVINFTIIKHEKKCTPYAFLGLGTSYFLNKCGINRQRFSTVRVGRTPFRSFAVCLRTGFGLQVFSTARQKIGAKPWKRKFDLVT
jgi:hypothetical protein